MRRALAGWWAQASFGVPSLGRRVAVLAGLGTLIGLGEAAVVLLVVAIAAGGESTRLPVLGDPPPELGTLVVLALLAVGLLAAGHLASARMSASFGAHAGRSVQSLLVNAYLDAPWHAQNATRAGHLQDLVTTNAALIAFGAQQSAVAVSTAINLLVVVVFALYVSLWATVLLALAMVTVLVVTLPFRKRTQRAVTETVDAQSGMALELTETAMAARELRIFGVVEPARPLLTDRIDESADRFEAYRRIALATPPLTRDAALVFLILAITAIVQETSVSLTTLGVAAVLALRALAHAQALSSIAQTLVERKANLEFVLEQLTAWKTEHPGGDRPCPQVRRIELDRVGHTYEPGAPAALHDVTLRVEVGEMIGVVGRTGAGKSTLASVVLGITVPTEGSVTVDGVPLNELDRGDWHARTAWVAQDPRMRSGSVRENVRFLRDWIDDAAVEAAVAAAGLGPELERWPGGIDHDVGAAGAELSGGERQRVALARAIAGDPDLLVLDEPTSALDAHSEAAVRSALEELRATTAVVVIAHRLSTVRTCDRVAVIEGGRLVAVAPPQELERANPWFREALKLSSAS